MSSNNPYSAPSATMEDTTNIDTGKSRNGRVFRIHIALAILNLVLAAVILLGESHDEAGSLMFAGIYFVVIVTLHATAAWGARSGNEYSRWVSRIIGVLMLLGVPIGTMIGIALLTGTGKKWQKAGEGTTSADHW